MNHGRYLEDLENVNPTNFCIGVAGYPEKHFEAPNMEQDILNLKNKIDQGADYIVTQMCFDVNKYKEFVKKQGQLVLLFQLFPG
jgi:methylenetetrahydrofolate reductase (NADPH)